MVQRIKRGGLVQRILFEVRHRGRARTRIGGSNSRGGGCTRRLQALRLGRGVEGGQSRLGRGVEGGRSHPPGACALTDVSLSWSLFDVVLRSTPRIYYIYRHSRMHYYNMII